ncbi:lipid-A-disaccharide synthase [Halobacteriovorax marinus]|uniref:Lipid-A-disaccharide synthase n=1 Tax=Halobacteriovorax marinus TaxID=97084 RepID=A0A1Y5FAP5_9BACT|nr:lipid-A-disaccharide synthase [Halobacteriovorax marinus]
MKNCLIIAGEKSGEEHALSFMSSMKEISPGCKYWGVGGDELEKEGMELIYHLREFSSFGFSEVIGKIPFYFNALKTIEKLAFEKKCKVAILIDFQDFNMRLAKKLNKNGIKVLYYVAPQAWAWKAYRAKVIEGCVHSLFTIIPFEKKWFQDRGVTRVHSVAHPLWLTYKDELKDLPKKRPYSEVKSKTRLLLLPGSRNFEVKNLLPSFIATKRELEKEFNLEVGLVVSSNVKKELVEPYLDQVDYIWKNEELSSALKWADCSLAASGTVTLATALFNVPTVVTYVGSLLNAFIYYTFLSYEGFISLANIVHEEEVFSELTQERASTYNMTMELKKIISNQSIYDDKIMTLAKTKSLISGGDFDAGEYMGKVIEEAYGN